MSLARPIAQRIIETLFGPTHTRPFAVRYWDGFVEHENGSAPFTIVIRSAGALRRMLVPPSELALAEAFIYGDIDVEGDLEAAASVGDVAGRHVNSPRVALRLMRQVLGLPKPDATPSNQTGDTGEFGKRRARKARRLFFFGRAHSAVRDARAVRFHYDLGNDFYSLWLDPQMVYSCAYFSRPDQDLASAQTAKLDYICRKLRLQAGERFLDIGCGWGALVIHAARHYGVQATGITLSEKQAKFARQRVEAEGLADHAKIHVGDYRELGSFQFDKIASVGMVEHVGHQRIDDYFSAAHSALAPGGVFLNHGIVSMQVARPRSRGERLWRRVWGEGEFIDKYVFPDGELLPSGLVVSSAESIGFELRDAENLREHYVMTLRHWRRRLEEHEKEARAMVGDATYRVWRLYLASSAYGFRVGRIGVVQSLFAKHDAKGVVRLPLRRNDLYERRESPTEREVPIAARPDTKGIRPRSPRTHPLHPRSDRNLR